MGTLMQIDSRIESEAAVRAAQPMCIIMNEGAGKKGANGETDAVRRHVSKHGDLITLKPVHKGGSLPDVCKEALDEGFQTIVAAGGDGTIVGVAECLADTGRTMGVLPLGTFNYFARANGIPLEIGPALEALHGAEPVKMHVGEVNGKIFLNNASLGLYPAILSDREKIYKRFGRSRLIAYWSVLRTLMGFSGSRLMKVTVDGTPRRVKTPLVFVAFSAFQLESFNLEGAEHVRNGEFAVFVAPDCGRWGLLKFAVLLGLRGMRRHKDFELFHGKEVVIEPADGIIRDRLIARDGEKEKMAPPYRFKVRENALNVILPKGS